MRVIVFFAYPLCGTAGEGDVETGCTYSPMVVLKTSPWNWTQTLPALTGTPFFSNIELLPRRIISTKNCISP